MSQPQLTHYLSNKLQSLEILRDMHTALAGMRAELEKLCKKKQSKNTATRLQGLNGAYDMERKIEDFEATERARANKLLSWDGVYNCYDAQGREYSTYEIYTNNSIEDIKALLAAHRA